MSNVVGLFPEAKATCPSCGRPAADIERFVFKALTSKTIRDMVIDYTYDCECGEELERHVSYKVIETGL